MVAIMDDRNAPGRSGGGGFRSYADDTLRVDDDHGSDAAGRAQGLNDPWGQELKIHYGAPAAPEPDRPTKRRSRLAPVLGVGALVCGAAVAALLFATSSRDGSAERPVTARAPEAPSLRVQVAPAPAPVAAAPTVTPPAPSSPVRARPASPVPPVATPTTRASAVADGPIRVFVHITDASQRPAADRVRAELRGLRFAQEPVATPPVRIVARAPRRTEVRCLKHADCAAAERVARYLAQTLGTPVPVVDMSQSFGRDPAVRAGSLELWLRP
jgi:hypothetical protein